MVAELPRRNRAETFCRIWAVKEACVKHDGGGVPLLPTIETGGVLGASVVARDGNRGWLVRSWSPVAGYWAAVAVERGPGNGDFQLEELAPRRNGARFAPDLHATARWVRSEIAEAASWNAAVEPVRLAVGGDDCPCGDHATVTNGDARKYASAQPQPDAVADLDRLDPLS